MTKNPSTKNINYLQTLKGVRIDGSALVISNLLQTKVYSYKVYKKNVRNYVIHVFCFFFFHQEATRRMRAAICHNGSCKLCSPLLPLCFLCCGCNTRASKPAGGGGGQIFGRKWARNDSRTDSQQLYCSGSSWRGVSALITILKRYKNFIFAVESHRSLPAN